MKPKLLHKIIACPYCKSGLKVKGEIATCVKCKRDFMHLNGVLCLLTDEDKNKYTEFLSSPSGSYMVKEFKIASRLFRTLRYIFGADFVPIKRLKKFTKSFSSREIILDVGGGNQGLGENIINLDIFPFNKVKIIGVGENLPCLDESFDGCICDSVIEHVQSPKAVVGEIYRVLKKNGRAFFVIPFIITYHAYPNDYQRYTKEGLKILFDKFSDVQIGVYRGPSVALVNFFSDYISMFSFTKNTKVYLIIKGIVTLLTFPIKFLDLLLIHNKNTHRVAHCLYAICRK